MSLNGGVELPKNDSALVVVQDRQAVTVGQIRARSQTLSAELLQMGAVRALLPTDRADHLAITLFACQAARCDLVLHRGPVTTTGWCGNARHGPDRGCVRKRSRPDYQRPSARPSRDHCVARAAGGFVQHLNQYACKAKAVPKWFAFAVEGNVLIEYKSRIS
jgi:hypothetical protein